MKFCFTPCNLKFNRLTARRKLHDFFLVLNGSISYYSSGIWNIGTEMLNRRPICSTKCHWNPNVSHMLLDSVLKFSTLNCKNRGNPHAVRSDQQANSNPLTPYVSLPLYLSLPCSDWTLNNRAIVQLPYNSCWFSTSKLNCSKFKWVRYLFICVESGYYLFAITERQSIRLKKAQQIDSSFVIVEFSLDGLANIYIYWLLIWILFIHRRANIVLNPFCSLSWLEN